MSRQVTVSTMIWLDDDEVAVEVSATVHQGKAYMIAAYYADPAEPTCFDDLEIGNPETGKLYDEDELCEEDRSRIQRLLQDAYDDGI